MEIGGGVQFTAGMNVTGIFAKPDAPTSVSASRNGSLASPGDLTKATVTFVAPTQPYGVDAQISTYTATSTPGSITGTITQKDAGPITVNGLTSTTNYTFTVNATNRAGTSPNSSASNSIGSLPLNTVAPAVTGSTILGSILTTTTGTWTGSPTPTYTYQWQRAGVNIGSATNSTYTTVNADLTYILKCVVTASNSTGAVAQNSNNTTEIISIPVNTLAPAVTGTATVGQILTTTDGTWTGYPTPTYTYQWQRAGVNIGSATNSTYTLVNADSASTISCVVTATNSASTVTASSNSTSTVTGAPVNYVSPAISGVGSVGQVLTCSTGSWYGYPRPTYTYQWQRAGVDISGATTNTYTLVIGDYQSTVKCIVTATNNLATVTESSNILSVASTLPVHDYNISAGFSNTYVIRTSTNELFAWGNNSVGQIGDLSVTARSSPVIVDGNWLSVSAGELFAFGLKNDGTLWQWGNTGGGSYSSPSQVGSNNNWFTLATFTKGWNTSGMYGAINNLGQLYLWGSAIYGAFGNGIASYSTMVPTQVPGSWVQASISDLRVFAIRSDGKLFSWGNNVDNVLGVAGGNTSSPVQVGSGKSFTQVVASYYNAFGITNTNTLWFWGVGAFNYLSGDGTATNKVTPYQVTGSWNMVTVANGYANSQFGVAIAIKSDGTLWSWGQGQYNLGQGVSASTTYTSPRQIGTKSDWVSVDSNTYNVIAVDSLGEVYVWGNNWNALYNVPTLIHMSGTPVNLKPPTIIGIPAVNQVLSVSYDGAWDGGWSLVFAYQWERNYVSIAGETNSTYTVTNSDVGYVISCMVTAVANFGPTNDIYEATWTRSNSTDTVIQPISDYTYTIASGYNSTYFIERTTNTLYSWGMNTQGQLGDGTYIDKSLPVLIGTRFISIVGGSRYAIGLKSDGSIWSWGNNNNGQLGLGDTVDRNSPTQVGTDTNWVTLAIPTVGTGVYPMAGAINNLGQLYLWGYSTYGAFGLGVAVTARSTPVQLPGSWVQAVVGYTSFGIRSDGTLWSWGNGFGGSLGNGAIANKSSPVQVSGARSYIQVMASDQFTLAIDTTNKLYAWGFGQYGALGQTSSSTIDKSTPTQLTGNSWIFTGTGNQTGYGIRKSDNTLWSWGINSHGQIGDNSSLVRLSPVQVGSTGKYKSDWVAVSGGDYGVIALDSSNRLYTWGRNDVGFYSRVGDGTSINKSSPVQISISTNWKPISVESPVVSGTELQGYTLTTTDGVWTGYPSFTYTYQWQRAGVNISGAITNTYVTTSSDLGNSITCKVTATNTVGSTTSTSNGTGPIYILPNNTVAPAVTGTATVGQVLTTTSGTWVGYPTPTYTYQWQRAGVDISGATNTTYTLLNIDAGNVIRCVVTATNAASVVTANSNSTATVTGAPVNYVAPAVTGTGKVGTTLTSDNGSWYGYPTPTYTYQWQKAGSNISGATTNTYTVVLGDISSAITCIVTATNISSTVTATSNSTTAVAAGYSVAFSGNGYIGIANNGGAYGIRNNLTIEFWMYPLSKTYNTEVILSASSAANQAQFITIDSSNRICIGPYYSPAASGIGAVSTNSISRAGVWYHVALSVRSGTADLFVNGVRWTMNPSVGYALTGYNTGSVTVSMRVGNYIGGGSYNFTGFISNMRILTAGLYTGNFTPPTAEYTTTTAGSTGAGVAFDTLSSCVFLGLNAASVTNDSSSTGTVTSSNVTSSNAIPFT